MTKDGSTKIKDLRASLLTPNQQELKVQELQFSKELDRFRPYQIHSPVALFIKNYKQEKLTIYTKTQQEQATRLFLLLLQMEQMYQEQEKSDDYIRNILSIIKGQDLQSFKKQINHTKGVIKKIIQDSSFTLPTNQIVMQKKGKITHQHVIRNAYLTNQIYGQIKNSNIKKLFKPQNFADNQVYIDTKTKINEIKKQEEQDKKNKIPFKKTLKWIDQKDCNHRLRLKDNFNQRERALYFKSFDTVKMLKNNVISQRIFKENPDRGSQIKTFNNIWKIKQAEFFYQYYLKKLFQNETGIDKNMKAFNVLVQDETKAYLKRHHPNLYDAGYDPMNTYDFQDNQHLVIQNKKKHDNDEVDNKDFATRIGQDFLEQYDDEEISAQKKKLKITSPFQKLVQKQIPNPVIMKDFVSSFEGGEAPVLFDENKQDLYKLLAKNNLLILNFNKIVIDNVFFQSGIHMDENEIDNLIFKIECSVEQGNQQDFSMVFVEEQNEAFLAFDIDCSFKVDLENLKNIRFKIVNKKEHDELLHDSIIDLQNKLATFQTEMMFFHEFQFDYKGVMLNGVINFLLVSIPRNLEISHLILNRKLIETNFEKFGELLNKIEDYVQFRKYFFPNEYLEEMYKDNNVDFFYFFNNSLSRDNDFVRHQENMFYNSFKFSSLKETITMLRKIIESKGTIENTVRQTHKNLDQKIKKHIDDIYDVLIKVSNLISNQERLLLTEVLSEFENQFYINYNWFNSQSSFHKPMVILLSKVTGQVYKEMKHLTDAEKYQGWCVLMKTYLTLDNNIKQNEKFQVFFSRHYVKLVVKISQLNSPFLKEKDVVKLCVNAILNQNFMPQYSLPNNYLHLNSALIFYKILFKRLYPDEYQILSQIMISYDQLLMKCVLNSYADIFDTINMNMYLDFKNTMKVIFLSQESNLKLMTNLKELGISFHAFIDVIYFMSALKMNCKYLSEVDPQSFIKNIKTALQLSFRNFSEVISMIMKGVDYLFGYDFLKEEYFFFKKVLEKTLQERILHFQNFSVNIKSLKYKKEQILTMIKKEMMKNDFFTQRAQVVFINNANIDQEEDDDTNIMFNSILQEDIFFEIADNFDEDEDFDFDKIEKQRVPKFQNCVLFLNNIDQKLIKNSLGNNMQNQTLHNILQFGNGDFQKLLNQGSEAIKSEIYLDLSLLQNSEEVSLIKLIIGLILTHSDNKEEILELLHFLVNQLTSIYYDNSTQYFDQIVSFIINEINCFLPFGLYDEFEKNNIQNLESDLHCYIKTGTIVLSDNQINITSICLKHFVANSFKAKKPCIQFSRNFCEDLEEVFKELIEKKQLDSEFEKFEVYLHVSNQQVNQEVTVAFKISFEDEIRIFPQFKDAIYFQSNFGVKNLMDKEYLDQLFYDSPFCFYEVFSTLKSPLYFTSQNFCVKFYSLKEQFLTLNFKFKDVDYRNATNLLTWTYFTPKNVEMLKFKNNQISLEVPTAYFFLNLGELLKGLCLMLIEKLHPDDVFKFIQLNNDRKTITNEKNKDIDFSAHICELKEYDNLKSEGTFTMHFIFKP